MKDKPAETGKNSRTEHSHKFFSNRACRYFPCHTQPGIDAFNCLFCYCPLYALGAQCGGVFTYRKGVKICESCHLPHMPDSYDIIVSKLGKMADEGKYPGKTQ